MVLLTEHPLSFIFFRISYNIQSTFRLPRYKNANPSAGYLVLDIYHKSNLSLVQKRSDDPGQTALIPLNPF